MIIVRYIADDTIEGYVENKSDFIVWLRNHNHDRKKKGESVENEWEFELIEVKRLIK